VALQSVQPHSAQPVLADPHFAASHSQSGFLEVVLKKVGRQRSIEYEPVLFGDMKSHETGFGR
jgi:hypothetical protein